MSPCQPPGECRLGSRSDEQTAELWSRLLLGAQRLAGVAHSAVAVHELLLGPPGCRMKLGRAADLFEPSTELCVQLVGAVPHDVEPTATGGPFGTERRDDDVTA